MTNPTPSYDDLMTQLAAERLHNPWWTSVPKPTDTDDDVTCARRRRPASNGSSPRGGRRRREVPSRRPPATAGCGPRTGSA